MVTSGMITEQGPVQYVGKPRERVPIAGMPGGERPNDLRPTQASLDVRVRGNVIGIIIIDELEGTDARKGAKSDEGQQAANCCRMTDIFSPGGLRHSSLSLGRSRCQGLFRREEGQIRLAVSFTQDQERQFAQVIIAPHGALAVGYFLSRRD